MPFACCPVCGDSFHLAVRSDIKEWERQHVRERSAQGIPLLRCIRCWVELKAGHQVKVRSLPSVQTATIAVGQYGVVTSVGDADGQVTVRIGEMLVKFNRTELSYVVGQEPLRTP